MRESFVFYKSFYNAIKFLPEEERLQAYEAIFELALNNNDVTEELSNISKAIFIMAKPQIEANIKRYESGKKGGRPKKDVEQNQSESKTESNKNLTQTKEKPNNNQNETELKPNVNENVNVNVNENEEYNKPLSVVSSLTSKGEVEQKQSDSNLPRSSQVLLEEAVQDAYIAQNANKEFLHRLIKYRRSVKRPFKTLKGIKGVIKDFAKSAQKTGLSLEELFEIMSEKEWLTIKPQYLKGTAKSDFKTEAMDEIMKFASRAKEEVIDVG